MTPQDLLTHYGTQAAAAVALRKNKQTVSAWFKAGRIPLSVQIEIEVATAGKLKAGIPQETRKLLAKRVAA